ncbi:MAG TPA: hypothetical protein VHG51_07320, partial [Longimicrobiaceae bacterium]|nr:hypothetical protein [Longimicrobiaceae bacterium]
LRSEAGLSLVELAVAVSVLGLALALAAPAMPRSRAGADATAHALAAVLARGRLAAVREGLELEVEVDAATGAYRVRTPAAGGADSLLAGGGLPLEGGARIAPAADGRAHLLRFGALGRAEGGPVRVRDAEGRGRVVEVDPWTGRVRVREE